jgi:hypothetical protein
MRTEKAPVRSRYQVRLQLDAATSVQEVSKVFEAIHRLERTGHVLGSIRSRTGSHSHPRVVPLTISADDLGERHIAIDLSDQRDLVDGTVLETVDTYFKRSFCPHSLSSFPAKLRAKVTPFGLNNPAIGVGAALRLLRARFATGRSLRGIAADFRQLLALPSPRQFECPPDEPAEEVVLFQTRVWPESDPETVAINEERAALVRTLRQAFGHRFIGGLLPTPFARTNYSDLITPFPYSMRDYPRLVRRALIAIYSRGLHDSLAFKMSEYLGASRCIVGHAPTTILPDPLVAGRNYLPFADPEECVAQCERLLVRTDEATTIRKANWAYYQANVEPAAQMLRVLHCAF